MKTRFTLTFVVDLPYPNEVAYPECSTPEDAIKEDLRAFEHDPFWLETVLERAEEVSLTAATLNEPTEVDTLNARLNEIVVELANLDFHASNNERKGILDVYKERERMQREYDETYTKLVQLRIDK